MTLRLFGYRVLLASAIIGWLMGGPAAIVVAAPPVANDPGRLLNSPLSHGRVDQGPAHVGRAVDPQRLDSQSLNPESYSLGRLPGFRSHLEHMPHATHLGNGHVTVDPGAIRNDVGFDPKQLQPERATVERLEPRRLSNERFNIAHSEPGRLAVDGIALHSIRFNSLIFGRDQRHAVRHAPSNPPPADLRVEPRRALGW
jgi:hypothetical protein